MKYSYKYFNIIFLLIISCSGGNKEHDFNGNWVKVLPANSLGGSNVSLNFSDIEFRMQLHYYTDIFADTCLSGDASWKEYLTGTFVINNGMIDFVGFWADSTYRKKETGCFNNGDFKETYEFKFYGKDTLVLRLKDSKLNVAVPEYDFKVTFVRR